MASIITSPASLARSGTRIPSSFRLSISSVVTSSLKEVLIAITAHTRWPLSLIPRGWTQPSATFSRALFRIFGIALIFFPSMVGGLGVRVALGPGDVLGLGVHVRGLLLVPGYVVVPPGHRSDREALLQAIER